MIAVNKETGAFTDEYLPEQRSHLYGITAVYPYCPGGKTHPNPIPLGILLAAACLTTLKISISPHSQEIRTPFPREQPSLHPEEFQTQRTVTAYKGGEVPSPRPMKGPAFLQKDFQVFFYSYTSRLYYCIFLPSGKR